MNKDHALHKKVLDEIHDTYLRKNADYGDSFGEQFQEHGLLSLIIRLDDKLRRIKQLYKNEAQVKDESIRDTILDLSNYGIMGVMELDKNNNVEENEFNTRKFELEPEECHMVVGLLNHLNKQEDFKEYSYCGMKVDDLIKIFKK